MSQEFFNGINTIKYEGPQSNNPLAFRHYDENRIVRGKSLKEHLRMGALS